MKGRERGRWGEGSGETMGEGNEGCVGTVFGDWREVSGVTEWGDWSGVTSDEWGHFCTHS